MTYPDIILGLIMVNNQLVVLDHVKINKITLPMGKVEKDELYFDTLKREMEEELNICVNRARYLTTIHCILDGVKRKILIYQVLHYTGQLINMEPEKHRTMQLVSYSDFLILCHQNRLDTVALKCKELNLIDRLYTPASSR